MTVADLIDVLRNLPPDSIVVFGKTPSLPSHIGTVVTRGSIVLLCDGDMQENGKAVYLDPRAIQAAKTAK